MGWAWGVRCVALCLAFVLGLVPSSASAEEEGGLSSLFKKEEPKREPLPWELPKPGEEVCMPEEYALLRELRERSRQLDEREAALDLREAAAVAVEQNLEEDMARLDGLRAEMMRFLERANDISAENVASLAKMIDSMRPKDAAPMLSGMDDDVVLDVLRKVKPKQAAKILGAMPASLSQALGDRFTLVPDPREGASEEEAK